MKTLIAALALTVAAPTLAYAIPPCRVNPRTICTIDGPADQRRIPMPVVDPDGPSITRLSEALPMNPLPRSSIVINRPAPQPVIINRTTVNRTVVVPPYPYYAPQRHFIPPFSLGGRRW